MLSVVLLFSPEKKKISNEANEERSHMLGNTIYFVLYLILSYEFKSKQEYNIFFISFVEQYNFSAVDFHIIQKLECVQYVHRIKLFIIRSKK